VRAAAVHSLPGRVRFRVPPGAAGGGIAKSLDDIPGVKSVAINSRTGGILIRYDHYLVSQDELQKALEAIEVRDSALARPRAKPKDAIAWSWIGWQLFRLLVPPALKPFVTAARALPFFVEGLRSFSRARLDVPALDGAALGASLAQGNVNAASTLIMLLKAGEYLEAWAKERSRENLAAALSLKTGRVWVRAEDGTDSEISCDAIRQGDRVVLRSGAFIPIDGKVIEGRAMVNEAVLTGEPLPAEKNPGGVVYAGTVIAEGELTAEVLKKGEDTRYERIIRLIEQSEGAKADIEIRAGRIADKAVPFTFAAAALTWFISRNGRKAAAVLSVDYSCAIKLATPLAFLAGVREGLENGVFFKGGAPMEKLAACDTIVFDKTGTLTPAAPALAGIIPYNGFSETSALKIAACLEEHFPHPVAKAVVAAALERNIRHREEHSSVKYNAAHGIASEYRGKHTVIGSRHFIGEDEGVDLSAAEDGERAAAEEGYSVLYLAQERKLAALLLIKDPPREEAAEVITMLRMLGVTRIYLLSGDNSKTTERIGRELALDGWRGDLLPEDKRGIIRHLRERGCRVAFVGDGMNDSPAMSAADVGIAMKDGADLARETADISLKESSLYPLVIARLMAQRVMLRVSANTRAAILLNSIFILLGLAEKPGPGAGSSRSVWLHNLTTLALSMNAMRPLLQEAKK
jgi:Cu2+-exporting ATPase